MSGFPLATNENNHWFPHYLTPHISKHIAMPVYMLIDGDLCLTVFNTLDSMYSDKEHFMNAKINRR